MGLPIPSSVRELYMERHALIDYDWTDQDTLDTPVKWHCGDPEVDPWEWRMRVLEERRDVAYSKVFFKTSGYITKDWYPRSLQTGGEKTTPWQAAQIHGAARRYTVLKKPRKRELSRLF